MSPSLIKQQHTSKAKHNLWKTRGGYMVESDGNVALKEKYKHYKPEKYTQAEQEFQRRVNCY